MLLRTRAFAAQMGQTRREALGSDEPLSHEASTQ